MKNKLDIFLQKMKKELENNSHKGNWEDFQERSSILLELEWHKAKLLYAMREENKKLITEYLADCANCLLFLGNSYNLYD